MSKEHADSRLLRYGFAVAAVALAAVLQLLLATGIQDEGPFLLFFGAVTLSALVGGWRAGLFSTGLAAFLIWYFFFDPFYSFALDGPGSAIRLGIFVLEGSLISMLVGALRSARLRSELSALEVRRSEESAQERVRKSEERLRLLVEGMEEDYAIFMLSPNGRVASWNEGAGRMMGYEAEEIIGEHFSRFYTEEDVRHCKPERELEAAAVEGRFEEEGWRVREDGSKFWANSVITASRDGEGNLGGFLKVTRDVTGRKQVEERLRQAEARYRTLVERMPAVTYIQEIGSSDSAMYMSPR